MLFNHCMVQGMNDRVRAWCAHLIRNPDQRILRSRSVIVIRFLDMKSMCRGQGPSNNHSASMKYQIAIATQERFIVVLVEESGQQPNLIQAPPMWGNLLTPHFPPICLSQHKTPTSCKLSLILDLCKTDHHRDRPNTSTGTWVKSTLPYPQETCSGCPGQWLRPD